MIIAPASAPSWAHTLAIDINREIQAELNAPVRLSSFTVSNLPKAATYLACWVYVTDETGGAVPCFSDGTNWRRCTDRAIAS